MVAVAAFLIGLTKAGLGGGLGPIITASMVLVLPVEVALGVQLPMLLIGDVFSVAAFWKRWSLRHARRLLLGAVPGVLLGTYLLASIDATLIQRLIGVVALSFVIYRFAQRRLQRIAGLEATTGLGIIAGAGGAVASTVAHAGAPPVSAYLLAARLSPVTYTATHILVFAVINVMKVPGYLLAGFTDIDLQIRLLPTLLFLPLGVLTGRWILARVSPLVFDRIILTILTVTGLFLLLGF